MRRDTFHQASSRDAVDAIVDEWRTERPDLDPSAKHITGRIVRLSGLFLEAFDEAFEPLGVSGGEYGVLSALRRAGAPYELTPTELARRQMMTSGGMTAAIDRLGRKGLVERTPNPSDRRGCLVRLTARGLEVIETAMVRHVDAEHRLVAPLEAKEAVQLERLLRKLLASVDRG